MSFKVSGKREDTILFPINQFSVDFEQKVMFPDSRSPEKVTVQMLNERNQLPLMLLVFVEDASSIVYQDASIIHADIFSLDVFRVMQMLLERIIRNLFLRPTNIFLETFSCCLPRMNNW